MLPNLPEYSPKWYSAKPCIATTAWLLVQTQQHQILAHYNYYRKWWTIIQHIKREMHHGAWYLVVIAICEAWHGNDKIISILQQTSAINFCNFAQTKLQLQYSTRREQESQDTAW